jgi:bifunctional non-homologous end joining protein LigD
MERPTGSLARYREKRDFRRTQEPAGHRHRARTSGLTFVVQRHRARTLHYDFRLELDGVLKSWAVPKEPVADPSQKRLAVHVEDHPLEYAQFEGEIPEKQYGAGKVEIWDRGRWIPDGDPREGYRRGALKFWLEGSRLSGAWALIRMRSRESDARDNWLLVKERRDDGQTPSARGGDASTGKDTRRASTRRSAGRAAAIVGGVPITHPDREFADTGVTKGGLARYYAALGERMLGELAGRPLVLLRCPGGDFDSCFVQRHASAAMKVESVAAGRAGRVIVVDSLDGILSCVQNGVIEFHTWGARLPRLDAPDRFVLDLDPDPALEWTAFRDGCERVRKLLDRLELAWFVKTTGGKGLHFVVPLVRRHSWDDVRDFTGAIARRLAREAPKLFTATMAKRSRDGKIYVDWLRNAAQASAVAAYSARARPGLPVSTPVAWPELARDVRGAHFSVQNLAARLARRKCDPWADYGRSGQRLTAAMRRFVGS